MKIASFNVNSVKARIAQLTAWLEEAQPDVVLLQEIKCTEDGFPAMELSGLGYEAAVFGQKSYNGVAILSRRPIADVLRGLPGDEADEQARYIEATIEGVRVASIYLPNGNPVESDKYPYKLRWMERLADHVRDSVLPREMPAVLGGDYNCCPTDDDVYDPGKWADDALCRLDTRRRFRALLHLGLTDAFAGLHRTAKHQYTYWDYVQARFQKDEGLRIDHLLLSPQAADRLEECEIDKKPRAQEKPSDHTPIWCRLG